MKCMFISFALFFALCSQPLLGTTDPSSPKQVVDTRGKKVRAGTDYYIRPVPTTAESGFVLSERKSNGTSCPLNVVVVDGFRGLPVAFAPVNLKKSVIRVSTDLNIVTDADRTVCSDSMVWKLDDFDASTGQYFVTTGGVMGNPGKDTVNNWFKIEKYEDDYKLVFCPTVCDTCKPICKNVGIFVDSAGNRRVALSNDPFKVSFQPYPRSS